MRTVQFQKAIPFVPKKVNYPCIGQPKINGGRCASIFDNNIISDLFANPLGTFRLHSKEGIELPVKHIIEELDNATNSLPELSSLILDGEIYQRGYKVATINGAARNNKNPIHNDLQYVIFDIINDQYQLHRLATLDSLTRVFYKGVPEEHDNWPLGKVIILPSVNIHNDEDAKYWRDKFISYGFEGLILREKGSFYTPGKHVGVMYKYKNFEIEEFMIVDIVPKPKDTHLPLIICKNNTNDLIFECVPMGTHTKQAKMLKDKYKYIGTTVYVKFYERTINGLPFNANVLELD